MKMPKLGESITEATITKWLKQVGDPIELDDPILELATDKVDSEIPSPVEGILKEQFFQEGDTVEVDTVIAVIETGEEGHEETPEEEKASVPTRQEAGTQIPAPPPSEKETGAPAAPPPEEQAAPATNRAADERFYSPLVRSIARKEKIPADELAGIPGSGKDGRLTRDDLLNYLEKRKKDEAATRDTPPHPAAAAKQATQPAAVAGAKDEVIEMDRMRRLIADHMVMSRDTSVHITLFREVDMTGVVAWRNRHKDELQKREGQKLTFTPIFIEAIAKALRDYPMMNVSLDGHRIIRRSEINIGMAAALPDGNLIVPVIRNADHKSLTGLAREVNDLAQRARQNQLKPDEIQGGSFTLTNFGTFGALTGTPIIHQPQVGILGAGLIQKKPVVIETLQGDSIGIRHQMMLSLGCDHRIVDGALGGLFLQRVAEYLENFESRQGEQR